MPKTKISEYSATANSNTDVASINIDEGCAPSGINNAIRAVMGHLKDFQSGTSNDPFTVGSSGSLTLSYGTAGGVAYLSNPGKVVTTGSALTFDGTNVDLGTVGAKLNFATTGSSTRNYIGGSADGYSLEMVMQRGASQPLSYKQNFSVGHEWGIAGSGAMTLTSTGLGIGTSSPVGRLEAVGGTGAGFSGWFRTGDTTAANNAGGGFYNTSSATATSRRAVMALDADGANLGGGDYFVIEKSGNSGTVNLLQYSNASMQFGTNYTNRASFDMALDSSGNLLVGLTTPTSAERLSIWRDNVTTNSLVANLQNQAATSTSKNSNTLLRISSNASGADAAIQLTDNTANNYWFGGNNGGAYVVANSNGVRLANGGTSWASDSDERIKDIIEPILDAANKVLTLRAVIGKYKTDKDGTRRSFLIAQDVQAVLPEAVFDEQGTLMLAYTDTIPLLVAAIQEQQALITQLTARITALEGA